MTDRDCSKCVFVGVNPLVNSAICEYPVPAYLVIRSSGGNFISGYEANACPLYKTKVDLVNEELK